MAESLGERLPPGDHAFIDRLLGACEAMDHSEVAGTLAVMARDALVHSWPLHDLIASCQLLVEACLYELDERDPTEDAASLRTALGRLSHMAASVFACTYTSPPAPCPVAPEAEAPHGSRDRLCGLVGASVPMLRLYDQIEAASRTRDTVLLVGESGTGKELIARAIHRMSGDPAERFVAINCAALPRDLMESELFGHRKGAFSGAVQSQTGLVRAAAGGTLFLDEISELPPESQAKLLRVIQEHAVRAVGETHETAVEVRIVAATNQRPADLLRGGRLRRDLFYRLERTVIAAPALRDHVEDLALLVSHLAERFQEAGGPARRFTDGACKQLAMHSWPGNVRELENVVVAACRRAPGPWVRLSDLPSIGEAAPSGAPAESPISLREAERLAIAQALQKAGGNKALASRVLGISRKQLYVKLKAYGLEA